MPPAAILRNAAITILTVDASSLTGGANRQSGKIRAMAGSVLSVSSRALLEACGRLGPYAEYTLAAVFLRTRIATGRNYPLIRVDFSHPRPPDTSEHERIFECPVRFGADACRLVIAREVWDTPRLDGGNPALFSVLDTHARMLLDRLPDPHDILARLNEAVAGELHGGSPRLDTIARRLAMSPRTLQRRLRERGVIFNDVVDEIRFRRAKAYLSQSDVAGVEVAYLLGFAEQSSFNRAFKRWSGQTPSEYRRRASA